MNAVVAEFFDTARKQAKGAIPAAPLAGVPYLIKDLNDVKGERSTSGSRLMGHACRRRKQPAGAEGHRCRHDHPGQDHTPEFGLTATTESVLLGACHNP